MDVYYLLQQLLVQSDISEVQFPQVAHILILIHYFKLKVVVIFSLPFSCIVVVLVLSHYGVAMVLKVEAQLVRSPKFNVHRTIFEDYQLPKNTKNSKFCYIICPIEVNPVLDIPEIYWLNSVYKQKAAIR